MNLVGATTILKTPEALAAHWSIILRELRPAGCPITLETAHSQTRVVVRGRRPHNRRSGRHPFRRTSGLSALSPPSARTALG